MSRTQPVSREDLTHLPERAAVAFAARCARRIQPMLQLASNAPDQDKHLQAIDRAIAAAEVVAGGGAAQHAWIHAESVETALAAISAGPTADVIAATAHAVAAAYGAHDAAPESTVVHAAKAAHHAVAGAGDARAQLLSSMWWDFDMLGLAAAQEGWDDDVPVPPEFFGPLWPQGIPSGWPAPTTQRPGELVFDIEVPEGVDDAELIEIIQGLADKMDELHRAYGGQGLQLSHLYAHGEIPVVEEAHA